MFISQDSSDYGYQEFYDTYLGVQCNQGLMCLSSDSLIPPSTFSAKEPRHVCLAALHGHLIYPFDEVTLKERVKEDGPYSKTLSARIQAFAETASEFNYHQRKVGWMSGGKLTLSLDNNDPFTLEQFNCVGLGGTEIAKAALEYETDREFFSLGQSGQLNHFARHLGFPNIEALKMFVRRLDDEAKNMGFSSYATICVATRYLDHLSKVYEAQPNARPALEEIRSKRDLLQRETVFVIERFMACRLLHEKKSFYVDINDEGVQIALHEGPFRGNAGTVTSQYLSDRSPDFHGKWFA